MRAQSMGKDDMLVFDEDIGAALSKVCERISDSDSDAVHLHVSLHRLYADACLTLYPSLVHLRKLARRSLHHTCCLH